MVINKSNMSYLGVVLIILLGAFPVLFSGRAAGMQEGGGAEAKDPQLAGFKLVHLFPREVPFGEGELFTYAIQYGLIYAGEATLEIRNVAVLDSAKAYHIISTARTSSAFDHVFKVRDRHDSFVDYENLFSLSFEKHLREGKFKRDEKVVFDQKNHVAIYADKKVPIAPNTQDFLSAVYYARTLPLEVGQAIALANHTGGKNYPIYIKVLRRERIKVPAGEFDCLVVEPILQTSSLFEQKGKLTIWITDDTVKMPVLLRSKVVIGAFEAVLKSYTMSAAERRIIEQRDIPGNGE
jgi:hypothetical protein